MISYKDRGLFGIIFSWTGSCLARCWLPAVLVVVETSILFAVYQWKDWDVGITGWTYVMVPIAFLLVFRNGMAYNRFFEGRNHIGTMVYNARELLRHSRQHITGQDEEANNHRRNIARLLLAFTKLNRQNLRGVEPKQDHKEVETFLTVEEIASLKQTKKNHPVTILMWIGDVVVTAKNRFIHDRVWEAMDSNIGGLLQAFMGMQKLSTTPMPFPYVQMILAFMYLWLFTLPIGMVSSYGGLSIPISFLLAYAFLGLNAIGEELEDPFGTDANDLPLEFFEGAVMGSVKVMLPGIPLEPEHGSAATVNAAAAAVGKSPEYTPGALNPSANPTWYKIDQSDPRLASQSEPPTETNMIAAQVNPITAPAQGEQTPGAAGSRLVSRMNQKMSAISPPTTTPVAVAGQTPGQGTYLDDGTFIPATAPATGV